MRLGGERVYTDQDPGIQNGNYGPLNRTPRSRPRAGGAVQMDIRRALASGGVPSPAMDQESAGIRSPDLLRQFPGSRSHRAQRAGGGGVPSDGLRGLPAERYRGPRVRPRASLQETAAHRLGRSPGGLRSEEHTSELQSR